MTQSLGQVLLAARESSHEFVSEGGEITVSVDTISFIDAENAAVLFTIAVDGMPLLHNTRGEAVLVDGKWKMARSTFCRLATLAGVECPPEVQSEDHTDVTKCM
ncbi:MAG: hypothetical protein ACRDV4_11910 [Acidimicrobiales bacterium]